LDPKEGQKVLSSVELAHFQLFAPSASLGTLPLKPRPDDIVIQKPFFIAITHDELNEHLEVPFFVSKIEQSCFN